jgi:hypothetical protein
MNEAEKIRSGWKEYWNSWYKRNHDSLLQLRATNKTQASLFGNALVPATQKDVAIAIDWIGDCYGYLGTYADVLNWFQTRVTALEVENHDLRTSLGKRDQEITNTLGLILRWQKESQETLDRAREYFGSLVGGRDESNE